MEKTILDPKSIPQLRALLTTAIEGPSGDIGAYIRALKSLDYYTMQEFRKTLPWDLRHYLTNRSYMKALNFVDSQMECE